MSYSSTLSETYSVADIEIVIRRVTTDLLMIANSTRAITDAKARDYGHDIELLAKNGYLKSVDFTLLSAGAEVRATRFEINTASGELAMSRPGGVLWPQVVQPSLRIVISYTPAFTDSARSLMSRSLKNSWGPCYDDWSHAKLTEKSGRTYASNGYGIQRKDFS